MENNYIDQLFNKFKNVALNAIGVERDLYQLLSDQDVGKAIELMDNNDREVDKAICEYNPQTHPVMHRKNKPRKGDTPYITEKLPRTRQRYINEIELFFLLGKPIEWKKDDGDDEVYELYLNYLQEIRFDSMMRKVKRLAGSETESAISFNITRETDAEGNENIDVKPFVVARSLGYRLRPMFDQYGDLVALAYGYNLRETGKNVHHWDILTKDYTFYCKKTSLGWSVDPYPNPTGKINSVYFKQKKSWDGAVPRLEREEMLDSKVGDTNNYFADPMASATADVIQGLKDADKPGRIIQLTGSNSSFSYITPPQDSEARNTEMGKLQESILFDTFTPDFSYDNMKGLGTLSGVAMHNALILGFIKRDNNKEIYGEMVDRLRSVIFSILKLKYPNKASKIDKLKVSFKFAEPFDDDKTTYWNAVGNLRANKLVSLETAVGMLGLTKNPEEECDRIRMEVMQEELQAQEIQKETASEENQNTEGNE